MQVIKKGEKVFIIATVIIAIVLLLVRLNKEKIINKNGAFVIGIVREKDWLENGYSYKCEYHYNNKRYLAEFTGIREDTLIFFKISRNYPNKWKLIEFERVPGCFKFTDVPMLGWSDLPTCDSLIRF